MIGLELVENLFAVVIELVPENVIAQVKIPAQLLAFLIMLGYFALRTDVSVPELG